MNGNTRSHRRAADGSPRVCDSAARVVFSITSTSTRGVLPGDGLLRGVLRVALRDEQRPLPPGRRGWHQLRSSQSPVLPNVGSQR